MTPPFGYHGPTGACIFCGHDGLVAINTTPAGEVCIPGGTGYTGAGVCKTCAQRMVWREKLAQDNERRIGR